MVFTKKYLFLFCVAFFATSSVKAVDYSKVCKNTTNYNGSATSASSSMTCDQYNQHLSQSGYGYAFENISWPNATCSDFTASQNTMYTLSVYVAPYCCGGDKKSICVQDYSNTCKTPGNYIGTNGFQNTIISCDNIAAYYTEIPGQAFYGINWTNPMCSDLTGTPCCASSILRVD